MGAFTPWKSANAIKQGFLRMLFLPAHSCDWGLLGISSYFYVVSPVVSLVWWLQGGLDLLTHQLWTPKLQALRGEGCGRAGERMQLVMPWPWTSCSTASTECWDLPDSGRGNTDPTSWWGSVSSTVEERHVDGRPLWGCPWKRELSWRLKKKKIKKPFMIIN